MKTVKDRIVFDASVSDRKILLVPVNTLKHTPYNPPSRTKEGVKLKKLIDSVKRYGQAYPILITQDRDVIDGNRRLAASRTLGIEFIECIVCDFDKDEAFSTVNTNAVPLGGKGWLSVARGGGWLPKKERSEYDELHALVGSYGIDLLISQNQGLNVLSLCKNVCAQGITKRLEEVIMLTAMKKLTNKLNAVIRSDSSRDDKCCAINNLLDS